MRKAQGGRSLQVLVVASCLLVSLSAAGGEYLSPSPPARGTGLAAFERNGKASLQRALDSLEPLVASRAG